MADPAEGPSRASMARAYVAWGWSLVLMEDGSKGPKTPGWNSPAEVIDSLAKLEAKLQRYPDDRFNMGLVHAPSGTVAIDIDDLTLTRTIFGELGIDLDAVLAGGWRIVSPKANRAKVLFAAPDGTHFDRKTVTWPARAGMGRIAIVDFRGGLNQDVLPPSAHPEGGFYAWAPEVAGAAGLPVLPKELADVWTHLDSDKAFTDMLQGMCPWAPKAPALSLGAPVRHRSGETANTIGQFNALHPIEEMLQHYGYKRRGKKWLSPWSTSGMPGVSVLDDGRAYVHHDSDPMGDKQAHDAFDFFVHYEYAGNFQAALEAAGREVGFHVEHPIDQGAVDSVRAILAAYEARRAGGMVSEVPEAPIEPPRAHSEAPAVLDGAMLAVDGFVGCLSQWIKDTAPHANAILAHVAAVSLAGVMLGRKIASPSGLRTNLMLISVARTGAGKDHPRKAIARLARYSGDVPKGGLEAQYLGPDEIASGSGLLSMLHDQPNVLCQLDEFGQMMKKWTHPHAGGHERDIRLQMMKAYGTADGVLSGTARADSKMHAAKRTAYPCLHIHGTTTAEPLYEALTGGDVVSGFLNRFLVYFTPESALTKARLVPMLDPPRELIEWCEAARAMAGPGGMLGMTPDNPIVMQLDGAAQRILDDDFEAEQRAHVERGEDIWARALAHATKLAMVYACSALRGPDLAALASQGRLTIDGPSAQRAVNEVRQVLKGMSVRVTSHVSDSEFDRLCKAIKLAIEKTGERGATRRDLGRMCSSYRAADDRQAEMALTRLKTTGEIYYGMVTEPGVVGRPRLAWVSRAHAGANTVE